MATRKKASGSKKSSGSKRMSGGSKRKSSKPKYGTGAQKTVKSAMHRAKRGKLKSGKGRHPKVKSRKQAIAIGLSEARKKGAKVPRKKAA